MDSSCFRWRRFAGLGAATVFCLVVATSALAQSAFLDALRKAGDEVIESLRTGDMAAVETYFDPVMRRAVSHERAVATAAALDASLGKLQTCDKPTIAVRGSLTLFEYPCTFGQASRTLRLVWTEIGELTGYFYLQPRAVVSAAEGEEGIVVGAAGWPLPGTLRRPKAAGVPPVVVLVHGSGAHNRDETIGPNAPLRDLAAGLAARGIASLRYDKRAFALSERFDAELPDWTLDDQIVDDAVAAVDFAATRPGLGPVFVVGHSEGAWLAPRIAAAAAKRAELRAEMRAEVRAEMRGVTVAGIVLLAGNVTPVADLIVRQYEFAAGLPVPRASQADVDAARRHRDHVARLVEADRNGTTLPTDPMPFDIPASAWLDIARYDPAAALLAQPRLPALLTFGARDFQVPISEKAAWEARLGSRPGTTLVAFAAMNHLLVDGSGPMSGDEYLIPAHVSEALIDVVSDWIHAHARRPAPPG